MRRPYHSEGTQTLYDMMQEGQPTPEPEPFETPEEVRHYLWRHGLTPVSVYRTQDLFTAKPAFVVGLHRVTRVVARHALEPDSYGGPEGKKFEAIRTHAGRRGIIFDMKQREAAADPEPYWRQI